MYVNDDVDDNGDDDDQEDGKEGESECSLLQETHSHAQTAVR
jgi:hypothetical protein